MILKYFDILSGRRTVFFAKSAQKLILESVLFILMISLSETLLKTLNSASRDIRTNKTLHCEMTYYNGPPIFHKVSSFPPNNLIN